MVSTGQPRGEGGLEPLLEAASSCPRPFSCPPSPRPGLHSSCLPGLGAPEPCHWAVPGLASPSSPPQRPPLHPHGPLDLGTWGPGPEAPSGECPPACLALRALGWPQSLPVRCCPQGRCCPRLGWGGPGPSPGGAPGDCPLPAPPVPWVLCSSGHEGVGGQMAGTPGPEGPGTGPVAQGLCGLHQVTYPLCASASPPVTGTTQHLPPGL